MRCPSKISWRPARKWHQEPTRPPGLEQPAATVQPPGNALFPTLPELEKHFPGAGRQRTYHAVITPTGPAGARPVTWRALPGCATQPWGHALVRDGFLHGGAHRNFKRPRKGTRHGRDPAGRDICGSKIVAEVPIRTATQLPPGLHWPRFTASISGLTLIRQRRAH
jgi:hypothetical protein